MRGADHVLEVEEGVVDGGRLLLPDVEPRRSDPAPGEALEEGPLVLRLAAAGVDEDHPRLHLRDGLGVDDVLRLRRQRRVYGDHVGLRKELIERDRLRLPPPELVRRDVRVVAEHARDGSDAPPDVADADDAEGLTLELEDAQGPPFDPLALARRPVDRERLLRGHQHEHDRVLSHRVGVRARRVDDRDAEPRGGGQVDGVEPDAVAPDDLQLLAGGHQALAAVRPDAEQNALGGAGRRDHPVLGQVRADRDPGFGFEQRVPVWMNRAREDDERFRDGGHGSPLDRGGVRYLVAIKTRRGASKANGEPSRLPWRSTRRQRSGRNIARSSWAAYRRNSVSPRRWPSSTRCQTPRTRLVSGSKVFSIRRPATISSAVT